MIAVAILPAPINPIFILFFLCCFLLAWIAGLGAAAVSEVRPTLLRWRRAHGPVDQRNALLGALGHALPAARAGVQNFMDVFTFAGNRLELTGFLANCAADALFRIDLRDLAVVEIAPNRSRSGRLPHTSCNPCICRSQTAAELSFMVIASNLQVLAHSSQPIQPILQFSLTSTPLLRRAAQHTNRQRRSAASQHVLGASLRYTRRSSCTSRDRPCAILSCGSIWMASNLQACHAGAKAQAGVFAGSGCRR